MNRWMNKLSYHYQKMRHLFPDDRLIILFDIDGTIVDARYTALHALNSFDRIHGTSYFDELVVSDITMHEDRVDELLEALDLTPSVREQVGRWYRTTRWSSKAILDSHRPYHGVMEVMRWFQLQPNTCVGLNTGRNESLREDTLRTLNFLGTEYKVEFDDRLLFMNKGFSDRSIPQTKVDGVNYFRNLGYRVFSMIDSEPENLEAVSQMPTAQDVMLLHADTVFHSQRQKLPQEPISGSVFDRTEIPVQSSLPRHVQLVWHGINDEDNLHEFMKSNVEWGEMDLRLHPKTGQLVLLDELFGEPPQRTRDLLLFEDVLRKLKRAGKSAKIDLEESESLDEAIFAIRMSELEHSRLWINGKIDTLQPEGFKQIAKAFPMATLQCPIDFMTPLMTTLPERAKSLLDELTSWGINRFSIKWDTPAMGQVLDLLDDWGFELNIYNVPDLQAFLRAALMQPRSVTSDFNSPKWGRRSRRGRRRRRHRRVPAAGAPGHEAVATGNSKPPANHRTLFCPKRLQLGRHENRRAHRIVCFGLRGLLRRAGDWTSIQSLAGHGILGSVRRHIDWQHPMVGEAPEVGGRDSVMRSRLWERKPPRSILPANAGPVRDEEVS